MKYKSRFVPALSNHALIHNSSSRCSIALLVLLLGWLCIPSEAQAATKSRKKPTVPTGLSATPASCSQINLSWTASTDAGGSGLMAYKIYRNGVLFKQVLAPATEASDVGLAPLTRYSYAILAIDKAGNKSAQAPSVSATTPACCTYTIALLAASIAAKGGSGTVTVTAGSGCNWSAVSSAPGWLSTPANNSGRGLVDGDRQQQLQFACRDTHDYRPSLLSGPGVFSEPSPQTTLGNPTFNICSMGVVAPTER